MKLLFWMPKMILEFIKANYCEYKPSSHSTRLIEQDVRNELRLAAYYTKRVIYGRES